MPDLKNQSPKRLLRLKSKMKLSSSPLLIPALVQKPRNGILFHQAGTVEMLTNRQGKLILANPSLTNDLIEPILPGPLCVFLSDINGRHDGGGVIGFLFVVLSPSNGYGGWRPEPNALREKDTRVLVGEGAGGGEIVCMSVGVEDFVWHFRPRHLYIYIYIQLLGQHPRNNQIFSQTRTLGRS